MQMNKTNRPAPKKKNLQQFMKRNHNFVRIDVREIQEYVDIIEYMKKYKW